MSKKKGYNNLSFKFRLSEEKDYDFEVKLSANFDDAACRAYADHLYWEADGWDWMKPSMLPFKFICYNPYLDKEIEYAIEDIEYEPQFIIRPT